MRLTRYCVPVLVALLTACGPGRDTIGGGGDGGVDAGMIGDAGFLPPLCGTENVTCVDQQIATLDLFSNVATGLITEEGTTAGEFLTHIDTRAGGLNPTQSFVYARFGPNGLAKLDLDDESAFASQDWDIAFRRYTIRVNSGISGPSCTQVARTVPSSTFESVTSVPTNVSFRTEEYFTGTCELISDGSGIGGPATAMASFWTYTACVKMTGNIYVLKLASGKAVKLEVKSYYEPAAQAQCDSSDSLPSQSGSGNLRIRWAYLP